ncbi:MAG: T9SS C-terminal target domain-containing protein [Cytophagales bacterium]|nr:MAG: T9SS C-terminal target domain-containing protein [Cytophagales bacterium]
MKKKITICVIFFSLNFSFSQRLFIRSWSVNQNTNFEGGWLSDNINEVAFQLWVGNNPNSPVAGLGYNPAGIPYYNFCKNNPNLSAGNVCFCANSKPCGTFAVSALTECHKFDVNYNYFSYHQKIGKFQLPNLRLITDIDWDYIPDGKMKFILHAWENDDIGDDCVDDGDDDGGNQQSNDGQLPINYDMEFYKYKPSDYLHKSPSTSSNGGVSAWDLLLETTWEPPQFTDITKSVQGYVCSGNLVTFNAIGANFLDDYKNILNQPNRGFELGTCWEIYGDGNPNPPTKIITNGATSLSYQAKKFDGSSFSELTTLTVRAIPIVHGETCYPRDESVNIANSFPYKIRTLLLQVAPPAPTSIAVTPTDLTCNGNSSGYFTFGAITSDYILSTDDVYVNYRNLSIANAGGTIIKKKNETKSSTANNNPTLPAGTYEIQTFIASSLSGCAFITTKTLNQPNILQISSNSTTDISRVNGLDPNNTYSGVFNISCTGLNNAWLRLNGSGGTMPYRYMLSTTTSAMFTSPGISLSNHQFSNLKPSTYRAWMTDPNNCPSNTITGITITEPPKLEFVNSALGVSVYPVSSGLPYNVRCKGFNDGWLYNQGKGGVFPYQFNLVNSLTGSLLQTATVTTVGHTFFTLSGINYAVRLQDANGCNATITKQLIEPTALRIPLIAPQGAICSGATDGKLITQAAGSVVERWYNYSISGAIYPNGAYGGIYTDQNLMLTTTSLNTFTGLSAGSYVLTVTDINGCLTTSGFVITEPGNIVIPAYPRTYELTCKGDQNGILTAFPTGGTPPFQYLWYASNQSDLGSIAPSLFLGTTSGISGLKANEYSLFVKDARGCSNKITNGMPDATTRGTKALFEVKEPEFPLDFTSFTQHTDCYNTNNGRVTLTAKGGYGGYNYLHGNSYNSTTNFENLSVGVYQFFYKDYKGCTSVTSPITITQPNLIQVFSNTKDITCNQASNGFIFVTVTGGVAPYSIATDGNNFRNFRSVSIAGIGVVSTISGLLPTSYSLIVKDANNCLSTVTNLTLTEPPLLESGLITTAAVCGSATGTALVTFTGGTLPVAIRWLASGTNTITGADVVSVSGLYANIYRAVLTDAQGCVLTTAGVIDNNRGPSFAVSALAQPSCSYRSDGRVQALINETVSSSAIQSVIWTDKSGAILSNTITATNLSAGIYTALVRDVESCLKSLQINLVAPQPMAISFANTNPSCYNYADGKLNVTITGGTGTTSYQAFQFPLITSTGMVFIQSGTGRNFSVLNRASNDVASGDVLRYQVTINDQNLCTVAGITSLQNPMLMTIPFDKDSAVICTGQSYDLDAGNVGSIYEWKRNNTYIANTQKIEAVEDGLYAVKATSPKRCEASKTFYLRSTERALVASFLVSQEVYVGDTLIIAEISKPEPDSVSWSDVPKGLVLTRLEKQAPQHVAVIVQDTGRFSFELTAKMGKCKDILVKTIVSKPAKEKPKPLRLGYVGIKSYEAFPNPTTGNITIEVKLTDVQSISVEIFSILGSSPLYSTTYTDKITYKEELDLSNYASGLYYVIFKSPTSTKVLKVVKN